LLMILSSPYHFSRYITLELNTQNFPFLKRLRLKTIVCFLPSLEPQLEAFAKAENINIIRVHVDRSFEVLTLKHGDVAHFLDTLKPANLPLLVHCFDGATSTGLAIACLRKQQRFNISFIIAEFCRYTR
jgi:protein tyrosine/serine phosphatase